MESPVEPGRARRNTRKHSVHPGCRNSDGRQFAWDGARWSAETRWQQPREAQVVPGPSLPTGGSQPPTLTQERIRRLAVSRPSCHSATATDISSSVSLWPFKAHFYSSVIFHSAHTGESLQLSETRGFFSTSVHRQMETLPHISSLNRSCWIQLSNYWAVFSNANQTVGRTNYTDSFGWNIFLKGNLHVRYFT